MPALAQSLMTVDEFIATADERDGRWELENGVAFAMAPERVGHARTKAEVFSALRDAIRRANLPCEALPDSVAVRISAHTAYQPDALVYCGPRAPASVREIKNPVIVVEVLSPTTSVRDQTVKLAGYFKVPSVMHYLILSSEERMVVHHQRGGNPIEPQIVSEGALRLDPPGLELQVSDLFPPA